MQHEKAYAKINLFLDILSKRPDGYHDIGTLFQMIDLHDDLSYQPAPSAVIELTYNAPQDYPVESDLVYRAARALQAKHAPQKGAHLHLVKRLPLGAGLGGGSADAAAALRLLNRAWELHLPSEELCNIGAALGADIPFLVLGGSALASGIGDKLVPIRPISLGKLHLVVATPHCHVPTKAAYAGITPSGSERWATFQSDLQQNNSIQLDAFPLFNKFEESVLPQYSPIVELKNHFLQSGAISALLSGSGASVFGFFESLNLARDFLQKKSHCFRFGELAQFKELC